MLLFGTGATWTGNEGIFQEERGDARWLSLFRRRHRIASWRLVELW